MSLENEQKLISKAQKDSTDFEPIFEKYYDKILQYVLRRTANVQIAEDITSETFLKALKNLWQFQWQGIPFSAWLYRIASNELKRYFRYPQKRHYSLDNLLQKNILEPLDSNDFREEIRQAEDELKQHRDFLLIQEGIKQLHVSYQEVISLRFFEGKKIKEIAKILKKREGTVKSLLSRGITKLKTLLKNNCNLSES